MRRNLFIAALLVGLCMLNTVNAQNKSFTVYNQTGSTVTSVSISPHDANSWSANLMANTKSVLSTETFDFKQTVDPANCAYDVKFTTDDGNEYYMKNVSLCKKNSITLVVPMK